MSILATIPVTILTSLAVDRITEIVKNGGDIFIIKNKSSIDRHVLFGDKTHRYNIYLKVNEERVFRYNLWCRSCWWVDDHASKLHFDVIGGTSGKKHIHMSLDLRDHDVVHHGTVYSHENIRRHGKLKN